MNKILVSSLDDQPNAIHDTFPLVPDGYTAYWTGIDWWTLMDKRGRINVSWARNAVKVGRSDIANKSPATWLRTKSAKDLRSNYQTLLGFDPVKTVNSGPLLKDQGQNSDYGGSIHHMFSNGKVQTDGTYMTDRMFISYAMWVSFDFLVYIQDIILQHTNFVVNDVSIFLPTDELHRKNATVNLRHTDLIHKASSVDPSLRHDPKIEYDVSSYVSYLRSDFNINISVLEYLKYMRYLGLFYKSCIEYDSETHDVYLPRDEFANFGGTKLFQITTFKKCPIPVISVHVLAHNATISQIIEHFGQIPSDTTC